MPAAPQRPDPSSRADPSGRIDTRIDAVVHLGFAVLMVSSAVRYVMRHSPRTTSGLWPWLSAYVPCTS